MLPVYHPQAVSPQNTKKKALSPVQKKEAKSSEDFFLDFCAHVAFDECT
jgi:hypothetical protein